MTVLIPISRKRANFSLIPCLMTSESSITPKIFWSFATTKGVAPLEATCSTLVLSSLRFSIFCDTNFSIASDAPLRI